MSQDPRCIAPTLAAFLVRLHRVPWFLRLGEPHPRDPEVVRIRQWADWHGPERGYGDWFGRYPAMVWERILADEPGRQKELEALWDQITRCVQAWAIPNVPAYDEEGDAWFGPTACVWHAAYAAGLIGWHLRLRRPLPDPIIAEWAWLADGHWPCDYAEEPPGHGDESQIDVPAGKLLVF